MRPHQPEAGTLPAVPVQWMSDVFIVASFNTAAYLELDLEISMLIRELSALEATRIAVTP